MTARAENRGERRRTLARVTGWGSGSASEAPVPGDSECTTAKPRETHGLLKSPLMPRATVSLAFQNGANGRLSGMVPSSWSTAQLL